MNTTTIQRKCPMCGEWESRDVDSACYKVWQSGTLLQHAFPELPVSEREFIKTGYCDKCQAVLFAPPKDEE